MSQSDSSDDEALFGLAAAELDDDGAGAATTAPSGDAAPAAAADAGKTGASDSSDDEDLFGVRLSGDEADDAGDASKSATPAATAETATPSATADAEGHDDAAPEEEEELRQTVKLSMPFVPRPPSDVMLDSGEVESRMRLLRLPNIVSVQSKPFDYDTFDEEEDAKELAGAGGEGTEIVIRWRWKRDKATGEVMRDAKGKPLRESNARIVEWRRRPFLRKDGEIVRDADGHPVYDDDAEEAMGYQLFIGDKVFDLNPTRVQGEENTFLYAMQKAVPEDKEREPETVLEGQALLGKRMVAKLHGDSTTRELLEARARTVRRPKVRAKEVSVNPLKEKAEAIKMQEQINRRREQEEQEVAERYRQRQHRGVRGGIASRLGDSQGDDEQLAAMAKEVEGSSDSDDSDSDSSRSAGGGDGGGGAGAGAGRAGGRRGRESPDGAAGAGLQAVVDDDDDSDDDAADASKAKRRRTAALAESDSD